MADEKNSSGTDSRAERLLIKVVLPRQGTEQRVPASGTKPATFRTVDQTFRRSLSSRLDALREVVDQNAQRLGSVPGRVQLLPQALAKTHRPETLFSMKTCPIVGAGKPTELFIRITPSGLSELNRLVLRGDAEKLLKDISAVKTIEPITPEFRRGGVTAFDILRNSPKTDAGYVTKVQLFDIGLASHQALLEQDFGTQCSSAGLAVRQGGYTAASRSFAVTCKKASDVDLLSRIVGVRAVRQMPVFQAVRPRGMTRRPFPASLPQPDGLLSSYPVVAVVDSGIRSDLPELEAWVTGRVSTVAPQYRNPYHGTFVGALVAFPAALNPSLAGIDTAPCAVFDVQVVPNSDPGAGALECLLETELLQDLETLLTKHANDIRVWNLSVGTDERCALDSFSSFAVELDRLQETYGVSLVLSAGNFDDRPMLDFPRTGKQLEAGRITTPADSVLGIAVGSVAHVTYPGTGPKKGELSPFSRHGAGPNYIIKPDLVHYGGTARPDGSQFLGVESMVDRDAVGDECGTSYSAPLVSRILANIYHQVTPTPSRELARAILTHHARDPRSGGRVADKDENFLGFGLPTPTPNCLECEPWMSTLVFEDSLRPGYYLEWDDFPYPASLTRNGRYRGDIWMTLAFAPARGATWGSEYCETHIEASFGVWTLRKNRETGKTTPDFKGLVPPEHKNKGVLWESFQVQNLRKWAPVRTYFGSLGPLGVRGSRWRLKLRLLSRHGVIDRDISSSQPFALIITIADPDKKAPIYDEMAVRIRNRFSAQNLALRAAVRVRTRT